MTRERLTAALLDEVAKELCTTAEAEQAALCKKALVALMEHDDKALLAIAVDVKRTQALESLAACLKHVEPGHCPRGEEPEAHLQRMFIRTAIEIEVHATALVRGILGMCPPAVGEDPQWNQAECVRLGFEAGARRRAASLVFSVSDRAREQLQLPALSMPR